MRFGRRGHSAAYRAHMRSPEWARIRRGALERARYCCQTCGLSRSQLRRRGRHLEVHHNNYRNLGREQPEDLVVLCAGRGGCHAIADQQRRAANSHGRRRVQRRSRRRRSRSLGVLRLPVYFVLTAGGLKVASIVLPAVS